MSRAKIKKGNGKLVNTFPPNLAGSFPRGTPPVFLTSIRCERQLEERARDSSFVLHSEELLQRRAGFQPPDSFPLYAEKCSRSRLKDVGRRMSMSFSDSMSSRIEIVEENKDSPPVNHSEDLSKDRTESKSLLHEASLDIQATHGVSRLKSTSCRQISSANRSSGSKFVDFNGRFEDGKFFTLEDGVRYEREDIKGILMQECETQDNEFEISYDSIACQAEVSANKSKRDAENFAIEALAGRAHTVIELGKKLRGKKYSPDIVESVISDFQARGLLDDYLYAETVARSRWLSMSWGPGRIKQALIGKGISGDVVTKALKQVFEEDNSSNGYARIGMSSSLINSLLERVSKHWLRAVNISDEKRKARITRWLQYRGFDWGVIGLILKKLKTNYPSNRETNS